VRKVAPAPAPVLLVGEPGTGKGILARCLHHNSRRAGGPFLRLDCSELAPTLLESELFGHERAAYAGAGGPQTGLLERAAGGSVFLDAVGALDAPLQARLLAALREGAFERVGGRRPIHCDVRLIAADGPELPEAAAAGRFHHELYQRLSPFPIDIPPLRERQADIEPLARHFLARAAQRLEKPPFTLADAALRALTAHHWPGNVRELELLMERAALRAGRQVEREDLALAEPAGAAPRRIDEIVRRSILDALCRHNGNRTHAARELGISLRTLQYRLRDYGVTVPSAPAG
jgi:DNA-binding NtrC family response regulator